MICLADKQNALKIAGIHKEEIKQGFLSSLQITFLEKLYMCVIENDFCVVAKENNEVVGFIAGTANIKKLYSFFVKKHFFSSIILLLPKIFSIKKIIEDIFYVKKEEISSELLTIAVEKEFQGQGIAKKMFELFVLEMKKRGLKIFKVVVGEELKPAISFYEKRGFIFLKNIIVHGNKSSRVYIYKIES